MTLENVDENLKIISVDAKDLRWPTSLGGHGSDAMVLILNFSNFTKSFAKCSFRPMNKKRFLIFRFALENEKNKSFQSISSLKLIICSIPIRIIRVYTLLSKQMAQLKATD